LAELFSSSMKPAKLSANAEEGLGAEGEGEERGCAVVDCSAFLATGLDLDFLMLF